MKLFSSLSPRVSHGIVSTRNTRSCAWLSASLFAAVALSSGCVVVKSTDPVDEPHCLVNDVRYDVGESYPAADGCNTCTCSGDNTASCTLIGCLPGTCEYAGSIHAPGDQFPALDDCNSCSCSEDGSVACTRQDCLPDTTDCGGIQGLTCSDADFCNFPVEANCGAADQLGECQAPPETCNSQYLPVCGCDGNTYGNSCAAAQQGVSVAAAGACETDASDAGVPATPLTSCGGFVVIDGGSQCGVDEFCQFQAGALCGAADAPGQCVLVPDACIGLFAPVCGCDGNTYSNSCEAAVAQMGIFEDGACQ